MFTSAYTTLSVRQVIPFGADHSFYGLHLSSPHWEKWQPGQFVMVRPSSFGLEIPWARPFGICNADDNELFCFFQVLGRGTQKLAHLTPNETVDVWGPLGQGFAQDKDRPTLLLAGGMGIAPFLGYVAKHPQKENLSLFFGHRQPLSSYPIELIQKHIAVTTMQENGLEDLARLCQKLEALIHEASVTNALILACGPMPFLRTVQSYALNYQAQCQLSLENRMACGVGACLGCVTKTTQSWDDPLRRESYVQVCQKGPVFWAHDVTLG